MLRASFWKCCLEYKIQLRGLFCIRDELFSWFYFSFDHMRRVEGLEWHLCICKFMIMVSLEKIFVLCNRCSSISLTWPPPTKTNHYWVKAANPLEQGKMQTNKYCHHNNKGKSLCFSLTYCTVITYITYSFILFVSAHRKYWIFGMF